MNNETESRAPEPHSLSNPDKLLSESPRERRGIARLLFRAAFCALVVLILLSLGAGLLAFLAYQHITQPGVPGETVRITIPEGATGKDAARILAAQGLVEHEIFFLIAIRLDKSQFVNPTVCQTATNCGQTVRKAVKQGWYALPRGLSPMELLHILQEGSNRTPEPSEVPDELKITIPEGLSIAQMAQQFANPEAFIEAASDPTRIMDRDTGALIARLGIKAKTLEGFLMPNTYYFDDKPTERQVVERMLAEFGKTYSGLTREYPPPARYDMLNIVTVASLVEEEAKLSEERPKVAAVIYNRLKKGMPLQLDSTLQYALNKYGQRMLYSDRETDSAYNTYKNTGLPPGPISSPGADALKAALKPADADYLYFVSNADGKSHTFSSNEADHLKAVRHFRKEIAPQRKALEKQEEITKERP